MLVTRPEGQQRPLLQAIEAAGGRPVSLPLMEIVAISDPERVRVLEDCLRNLDRYQIALFVSTNAAVQTRAWLDRLGLTFPDTIKVVAIGASTAEALAASGISSILPHTGNTSEDVLAMPELADVAGKHIAVFRGRGGRELIAEQLNSRCATLDNIELYERQTPTSPGLHLQELVATGAVDVITVTSSQVLQNLCELSGDKQGSVRLIPLLVPSERVRVQAIQAGFAFVVNAKGADVVSVIEALAVLADKMQA